MNAAHDDEAAQWVPPVGNYWVGPDSDSAPEEYPIPPHWRGGYYTYHIFSSTGERIYIGATTNVLRRLGEHSALKRKAWFDDAAYVWVYSHPDAATMRQRERDAILRFRPVGNRSFPSWAVPARDSIDSIGRSHMAGEV